MAGEKAQQRKKKRKHVTSREADGSHQQEGSDPDTGPVAAVSLPGLYKSDRMPAIDPKTVGSYKSDSESGDPSTPPASRHPSRGGKAALKKLPGLSNKQQQQKMDQQQGLQLAQEDQLGERSSTSHNLMKKKAHREFLPGRLRKKLAKERVAGAKAQAQGR